MKYFASFALFLSAAVCLQATPLQKVYVPCEFRLGGSGVYICDIRGVFIEDSAEIDITFSGTHLPGRSNEHVEAVAIFHSHIPFIMSQLFTTFPNLIALSIGNDQGLKQIERGSFTGANRLITLTIRDCPQLTTIQGFAFTGASNLNRLDLEWNAINFIDESAFIGLSNLLELFINFNSVLHLPVNIFQPLEQLQRMLASGNRFESIDGNLFANNRHVAWIDFSGNRINSIGRGFLDGLSNLALFAMSNNICANRVWMVGQNGVTIDWIKEDLEVCFRNSEVFN